MASVLHDKGVRFDEVGVPKTLDEEPGPTAYEAASSFHVEQQKACKTYVYGTSPRGTLTNRHTAFVPGPASYDATVEGQFGEATPSASASASASAGGTAYPPNVPALGKAQPMERVRAQNCDSAQRIKPAQRVQDRVGPGRYEPHKPFGTKKRFRASHKKNVLDTQKRQGMLDFMGKRGLISASPGPCYLPTRGDINTETALDTRNFSDFMTQYRRRVLRPSAGGDGSGGGEHDGGGDGEAGLGNGDQRKHLSEAPEAFQIGAATTGGAAADAGGAPLSREQRKMQRELHRAVAKSAFCAASGKFGTGGRLFGKRDPDQYFTPGPGRYEAAATQFAPSQDAKIRHVKTTFGVAKRTSLLESLERAGHVSRDTRLTGPGQYDTQTGLGAFDGTVTFNTRKGHKPTRGPSNTSLAPHPLDDPKIFGLEEDIEKLAVSLHMHEHPDSTAWVHGLEEDSVAYQQILREDGFGDHKDVKMLKESVKKKKKPEFDASGTWRFLQRPTPKVKHASDGKLTIETAVNSALGMSLVAAKMKMKAQFARARVKAKHDKKKA